MPTFSDLAEPHLVLVILTFFLIWKNLKKETSLYTFAPILVNNQAIIECRETNYS